MQLTRKEHIEHSKALMWWDDLSPHERIKIKEEYTLRVIREGR